MTLAEGGETRANLGREHKLAPVTSTRATSSTQGRASFYLVS